MELMDVGLAHFSRQVLDGLLDSNIGFAVFDDRLRYRFANEALAELHRVPAEAHEGESLRSIVGDAASKIERALDVVFDTGKVVTCVELVGNVPTRPDFVHWRGTHFPIRDGRGKLKQVGVFVVERGAPKDEYGATMSTRPFEKLLVNVRQTPERLTSLPTLGECSRSGAVSARIMGGLTEIIANSKDCPHHPPAVVLTFREREILRFLANGNSNKQISAILNISIKTVQFHRASVFSKLKLDSLAGLVRYAIRNRIVEP
jgi:DNA-binding CsgD family transcriptional regulator